ncbi:hypothetical protein LOZ41_006895, partial [Ophidiomyces ophidiicola]
SVPEGAVARSVLELKKPDDEDDSGGASLLPPVLSEADPTAAAPPLGVGSGKDNPPEEELVTNDDDDDASNLGAEGEAVSTAPTTTSDGRPTAVEEEARIAVDPEVSAVAILEPVGCGAEAAPAVAAVAVTAAAALMGQTVVEMGTALVITNVVRCEVGHSGTVGGQAVTVTRWVL